MEKDFFYGHGTPDPVRLGDKHLIKKFQQAIDICEQIGVELGIWFKNEAILNEIGTTFVNEKTNYTYQFAW